MSKSSYFDFIYEINGETIKVRPETIFEPTSVYLIVDQELKLIWIWAGSHSRLFHRYMAANWAGKLKTKKKFFNFKYEVIKQGIEPPEFHVIYNEIKENLNDLDYPGESRQRFYKRDEVEQDLLTQVERAPSEGYLSHSVKSKIKMIFSEIREMQNHIKYSMDHIQQRFIEIEKLLGN